MRLKKYFYVLRPVLACRWIMKYGTPPPWPFEELAKDCLDPKIVPEVNELLRMKRKPVEMGEGPRCGAINDYLDDSIEEITARIAELPDEKPGDWNVLNRLFLSMLR